MYPITQMYLDTDMNNENTHAHKTAKISHVLQNTLEYTHVGQYFL